MNYKKVTSRTKEKTRDDGLRKKKIKEKEREGSEGIKLQWKDMEDEKKKKKRIDAEKR